MKVILLQDVPKLGRKNEVRDVADGFAHNSLFPQRKAVPATPSALKILAESTKVGQAELAAKRAKAHEALSKLDGAEVTLKERANEKGHLFSRVSADHVAEAVKAQLGVSLEQSWASVPPIKEVGNYAVALTIEGKKGRLTLIVTAA